MINYKKTELATLATFEEEIPSQYFSHKDKTEFDRYVQQMDFVYRSRFKFPPKMFENTDLIDFGAGTGENTIYLANWGARCTLVEMNEKAQDISRNVFLDYAIRPDEHTFIQSSIFEYTPIEKKQYDIVHCRGVLSHTSQKEKAFGIISNYVKPGGYIIFGDPNKAGGFQNMLQRFAVYSFASTPDEMVEVSEFLFKEDIDRSEKTVPRTRRAIIFDRWVIQQQDDPSISEVYAWMTNNGLDLYSAHPPFLMPLMSDSYLDAGHNSPYAHTNLFAISELIWMMRTHDDATFVSEIDQQVKIFSDAFKETTNYIANLNKTSAIDKSEFKLHLSELVNNSPITTILKPLEDKLSLLATEVVDYLEIVSQGDLEEVRQFITGTTVLFKGAVGVRHVDFIAHKPLGT